MRRKVMLVAATCLAMVGAMAGSAPAQSNVPVEERFVLSGVVFVEGGRGTAWLQEPTLTKNEVVTVRPGDSIGAYRVTRILEDQVELEGPAGKFSVPLAGSAGMASVVASQGAAPQAPSARAASAAQAVSPGVHPAASGPAASGPGAVGVAAAPAAAPGQGPLQASLGRARGPVVEAPLPGAMQPPVVIPPHPALADPNAIVILRGDPRLNVPPGFFAGHYR